MRPFGVGAALAQQPSNSTATPLQLPQEAGAYRYMNFTANTSAGGGKGSANNAGDVVLNFNTYTDAAIVESFKEVIQTLTVSNSDNPDAINAINAPSQISNILAKAYPFALAAAAFAVIWILIPKRR